MAKILIVDDEKPIRATLKEILEFEKYEIDEASNGKQAIDKLIENTYDVVLCDIKMPELDGIEVLERAQMLNNTPQFIMISAHGNIETAVEATKMGAFDFLPKPPDLNRLLVSVKNATDKKELIKETKVLRKRVKKQSMLIGESQGMSEVKNMISKVAPTDARVLILGPNGSGKELVAKGIHNESNRNKGPMIEVNCAAIPSELIESELFGHEKGAFTSANKQRIGKFEQANDGTLFLDEIGDMSLSAQAKVVRALQENIITRVGGDKAIKVSPRVIAATNKDLKKEIAQGNFREDLYHRLSVIVIKNPSLNDRLDDVPLLVDKFLKDIANDYGSKPKAIDQQAIKELQDHNWSGNIRELRNVIERLVIMCEQDIRAEDVVKYK